MAMSTLTIIHGRDGRILFPRVRHARTAWQRLRGLLGRAPLAAGEGLLLSPCNSVHTVGMGYALDVVFLDRDGVVLKRVDGLRPMRFAGRRGARHALELPAGAAADLHVGDRLRWQEGSG